MTNAQAYQIAPEELIVDLFAGGGGASQGIFEALGRHPDIAINHDADAIAVHTRNHPETQHFCQSIWEVKPVEACAGIPVGLLWASPDCFPPGTLVLTPEGQKPIEQVKPGDAVLTHKGRWRPVLSTLTHEADTVEVRGHGHYGLITTPTHGFYSKRITTRYPSRKKENGKRTGPVRTMVENPYWPEAQSMAGKLWATPRVFPETFIPSCHDVQFSEDFFYFLGRWIGDGSLNKGDVEICCGASELVGLRQHFADHPLRDADGELVQAREVDHGSSNLLVWGHAALTRWLRKQCGDSCETKRIPVWCLSMQRNWREALLRGYVDADGHRGQRTATSSVSKALSIGARLLATTLGQAASLYHKAGCAGQIEGRSFMGQDIYRVIWTEDNQKETSLSDTLHRFTSVKEVVPAGVRTVVSLQVEEDESFIADGIVVHNCRHFSRAAGGRPKWKSVRSLPGVVLTWAKHVRPKVIMVENVPEMQDWGPLLDDGTPCPKRIGLSFRTWCGRLRGLGYKVEFRRLVAADYGVPTLRARLFIVARADGLPVRWPTPTHTKAPSLLEQRWRGAAECIDWSIPCPSIFTRVRPLKEATMKRIADGVMRYVVKAERPFIVGRNAPHLMPLTHQGPRKGSSLDAPVPTETGANRGEHALISAVLSGCGGRAAQSPPKPMDEPFNTITSKADQMLVTAFMAQHNGGATGARADAPLSSITASGTQQAVVEAVLDDASQAGADRVAAFLIHYYSNGGQMQDIRAPLGAMTTKARHALVMVSGVPLPIVDIGMRMLARHELQAAQGFPPDYDLTDGGRLTKTTAIRLIGNSVCPGHAAAVVRANVRPAPEANFTGAKAA